jgi:peptidoglycan/LPS O-acetylase OafA/YrhL
MRGKRNIPSLDGMRAISIAFVMFGHYAEDLGWGDPLNTVFLGRPSIFCNFWLSHNEPPFGRATKKRQHFSVSILRRTLRIFPAFYFYMACILLLSAAGWSQHLADGAEYWCGGRGSPPGREVDA